MHIVLIGPMGAGKSTIGGLLATRLGVSLDDSDEWISRTYRASGAEIAAAEGVAELHAIEAHHARSALAADETRVAALAASVVEDDEVLAMLADHFVVLVLASISTLRNRLDSSDQRRSLGADPAAAIEELATRRRPRWEAVTDVVVDGGGDAWTAVQAIIAAMSE